MISLFLAALLGQIQVVPASGVGNAITYSTAADVLYVDPTGNDSNQCVATGTSACLTIQGAINKLAKQRRYQATVNVAAGASYAGFTISGFTVDPAYVTVATNTGILIDGVLVNFTPATGTATGTATAGSAGSNTTYGTLTDGAQSWTVNDLRGQLVTITGGTGSGQIKVIVSNTATVLTIAGTWTAPTGTSTYAIQQPGVTISTAAPNILSPLGAATNAVNVAAVQIANNNLAASNITLRNITVGGSTNGVSATGAQQNIALVQVMRAAAGGGTLGTFSGGTVAITNTALNNTGSVAAVTFTNGVSATLTGAWLQTTGGNQGIISCTSGANCTFSSVQTVGDFFSVSRNAYATVASSRCDCNFLASLGCVTAGAVPTLSPTSAPFAVVSGGLDVINCTYGVLATGGATVAFTSSTATFTGIALTAAAGAAWGGSVIIPSTAPAVITSDGGAVTLDGGVVADMNLDDGTVTDTFTNIPSRFQCFGAIGTGSRICRQ